MNKVSSRFSLLVTSACAVLLLAGCGDERPGSSVTGNRRAPALNQEMMTQLGDKTAPKTAEKSSASPYDAYDASGKPKMYGAGEAPAPKTKERGLLDGWFNSPSKPKEEVKEVRKPISGNPYYSKDTEGVAPIVPLAPIAQPAETVLEKAPSGPTPTGPKAGHRVVDTGSHMLALPAETGAQPESFPVAAPVSGGSQPYVTPDFDSPETLARLRAKAAAPEPQPAPQMQQIQPQAQVAPEPEKLPEPAPQAPQQAAEKPSKNESSFFSRVFGSDEPKKAPEEVKAEENAKYVPLESVPKKPERFEEIKAESNAQLEQMQNEHAEAVVEREALANEQSDLADQQNPPQIPTVNSSGQPVTAAPSNAQPAAQPVKLPVPQEAAADEQTSEDAEIVASVAASAPAPAAGGAASTSSLPSPMVLKQMKAVPSAQ